MIYERDSKKPIYVSTSVFRALWLLGKAGQGPGGPENNTTPDALADGILRSAIDEKWPKLWEHQKQVEKMEKELLKNL